MVGVLGGEPFTVGDVNDVLLYLPRWTTKPTLEARASTTTLTDDDDLSGIPLEIGSFEIEVVGFYTLTTTATQKIQTRWGFSGTWNSTTGIRACVGPGINNTAAPNTVTDTTFVGLQIGGQNAVYDVGVSATWACFREICANVQVTVAGNFALQWSQNASSVNNTTLQSNSFVRVTRKQT